MFGTVSVRVSTKRCYCFQTLTKNVQDEHNLPLSNSIIGKKSDEKADKNSLNYLPVIDRSSQTLSMTLVISNFQKERKNRDFREKCEIIGLFRDREKK